MPPKRKVPFVHAPHSYKIRCLANDTRALDLSGPVSIPPGGVETMHRTIELQLDAGIKAVLRALKKAKGFEKQKLVKRIKAARKKNDAAAEVKLVAELDAVKGLDIVTLPREHILRALYKDKQVVSSLLLPDILNRMQRDEWKVEESVSKRNVVARLFNATVVKVTIAQVLSSVKTAMGLNGTGTNRKSPTARAVVSGLRRMSEGSGDDEGGAEEMEQKGLIIYTSTKTEPRQVDFAAWSDVSSLSEEFTKYDFGSRLATSSEEDLEISLRGDNLQRTDDEWSGSEDILGRDEIEMSEEKSFDDPFSSVCKLRLSEKKQKDLAELEKLQAVAAQAKPAVIPSGNSIFLPTLMAGYISGSDSGEEGLVREGRKGGNSKGPAEKKARKNRMGQCERRRIWEAKYGAAANHKKRDAQENTWRAKAGSLGDRRHQGRGTTMGKREGRKSISSKSHGSRTSGKHTQRGEKEEGPLHPSWEAARMAKEKQKFTSEAFTNPLGKKVTFD